MGQPTTLDAHIADGAAESQNLSQAQQLSVATQHSGEMQVASTGLAKINVERQTSDDGGSLTRFPNGIKFETGGVAVGLETPPGGSFKDDGHGNTDIYDSHNKKVGTLDSNKTLHVHTKNGEYTETKEGKVTFTPSGAVSDLSTLHRPGAISPSHMENYGISADADRTRFPNGIEYDPKNNKVIVPADYPNFNEQTTTNDAGQITSRSGYDGNGKKLYTMDATGLHVPTSDGTINQNQSGHLSFDSNSSHQHAAHKVLPKVDLVDDSNKKKVLDPFGPECAQSRDPICGLDMGQF